MEIANCLSCDEDIRIPRTPKIGMLVTCADCGAEFEGVWLDPWNSIDLLSMMIGMKKRMNIDPCMRMSN
jgi:lysine biosynthesis protein LysW